MKNYKIAILQHLIVKGGRFAVISRMIKNLNDMGIIPDLITGHIDFDLADTELFYGYKISVNLIETGTYSKHFGELQILQFNRTVAQHLVNYDWVINSSNTAHFLRHKKLMDYVHYPRKARVINRESLGNRSGLTKLIKLSEFIIINFLYKINKYPECKVYTNSGFSKLTFESTYDELSVEGVLYPPVSLSANPIELKKGNRVISLGRFHPSKKQLEIIKIAKALPDLNFDIVGFTSENDTYVDECKYFISENKLSNVHLHINLSSVQRDKLLKSASYFLHLLEKEPFGISTVQAIANACLPIVPDNGGQIEIVTMDDLRFRSIEEIPKILTNCCRLSDEEYFKKIEALIEHIQQFSSESFDRKFKKIIDVSLEK